jgi:PAS domain S-box-containing protein
MGTIPGSQTGENQDLGGQPEPSVFDRNPDPGLDELTELAAVLCNADYAYLGWVDSSRLWFKSRYGFRATDQPRGATACQWMLAKGGPLLIADAGQDERFAPSGIPLPDAQPCLSYAGVPLFSAEKQIAGTLAVLGRAAESFRTEHLTLLEALGRQVMTRLELANSLRQQEQAQRARQRAERALAIERCFVAATLDSIPALVAVLDTAGRVVRMNDSCAQLTGLNLTDATGLLFEVEFLEESDRAWATNMLRDAVKGRESGPHETAWRTVRGRSRRVSWTLRPLQGPGGEIQYLIVSGQDVTDQRAMEKALLSSEARYREMVGNSLGFVFTCSLEGRLSSLNEFTAETLGLRPEALVGRPVTELMDAAGAAVFQDCLNTVETGEEWKGALRLRRSDGLYRRIAVRSRSMQLAGERSFAIVHGMDVTEQYEAEEALHLATRQRELILESVEDGIFGIGLGGEVTFVNRAGARMLGYTPEELTGRDLHELVRHSGADGTAYSRSTSPILQALRRADPISMQGEIFYRKNGAPIYVELSASPLMEEGRISGLVVAFQDVSERRRLERMKDEFISTVSHELRTPLTSLRASLGLIQTRTMDRRPEKRRELIDMAIANSDRLTRLVNDILDFDNAEKRRTPLNRVPVEAGELLRRAADVAHGTATAARIEFRIEVQASPAFADPNRLMQVLNELVANAIKFSPPGTAIALRAEDASPAASPGGDAAAKEVCFSVADQGHGIAPEKLEHIFEPFHQGDASDSRALGGTGLGLALCRSIVEQHGGRIWVESEEGKGSRFLFTVPAAGKAEAA